MPSQAQSAGRSWGISCSVFGSGQERYRCDRFLHVSRTYSVDHRLRQQLHPIVPLLDAFKTEQQPLAFVLPRTGPFDPHPQRMDGSVSPVCTLDLAWASRGAVRYIPRTPVRRVGQASASLQALGLLYSSGKGLTQGMWTRARESHCFRDYKRLGFFTTLATRYNCQKNERNGNAYQRNHEYWPSPRLCRL